MELAFASSEDVVSQNGSLECNGNSFWCFWLATVVCINGM